MVEEGVRITPGQGVCIVGKSEKGGTRDRDALLEGILRRLKQEGDRTALAQRCAVPIEPG